MRTATPEPNGSRTHEPNLRELTAQLDDLKELMSHTDHSMRELMAERDRRYEDRFKGQETAVAAALSAQKEMTNSAFLSSEKAIVKAEEAQKSYNASHNDLARKMDEQNKGTIPRPEAEASARQLRELIDRVQADYRAGLEALRTEIFGLRESRVNVSGHSEGAKALWGYILGAVGLLATLLAVFSTVHK